MARSGVFGHGVFLRFWVADGISNLGTFVSTIAIQLLLINTLHADQTALGAVRAAQWLPYLLFGLFAGVVVDRVRRKPLLVLADVVCALALGTVGVLALSGSLTIPVLAALVFVAGSASMFFSAAHQSYLPCLVPGPALPTATARLEQMLNATQSAGPLVGGALVRLLSAPFAVLVDAASYLVSAVILSTIRVPEQVPQRAPGRHVWRELAEGASWVYRHRTLAPYAVALHLGFFFNSVVATVLVYFAVTELHLDAIAIGLVLSATGVTGVVGAGLAPMLARRYGLGLVHCLGTWFSPVGYALVLLAQPGPHAILWPLASSLVLGLGMGISGPLHMSYRNAVTPNRLRGRMNATIRSFNWGSIAVAAPLGGWIAATSGNRAAFVVGSLGLVVSSAIVTFSPYRSAEMPTPDEHAETPDDASVLDSPAP